MVKIMDELGFQSSKLLLDTKSKFFHKNQNPSVCLENLLNKNISFVVSLYEQYQA